MSMIAVLVQIGWIVQPVWRPVVSEHLPLLPPSASLSRGVSYPPQRRLQLRERGYHHLVFFSPFRPAPAL